MTYGIEPVVSEPEIAAVPDMTYGIEPVVSEPEIAPVPDMTYGLKPVLEDVGLLEGIIPDVSYMVNPVMADIAPLTVSDVSYNVKPMMEKLELPDLSGNQVISLINSAPDLTQFLMNAPDLSDIEGPAIVEYAASAAMNEQRVEPTADEATLTSPAFAPVITIQVQGSMNDEGVEYMTENLRSTVRELFVEFREEELERMALKNQYPFR